MPSSDVPCNTPGGFNCSDVIHVKRPFGGDWGVAVSYPDCDTGEPVPPGVVKMPLMLDSYDEKGNPDGKYWQGCCCDQFIIAVGCGGGPCCISLRGVCPDEIPVWDAETQILIIRSKPGTYPFCGYSMPPNLLDTCGIPASQWVIGTRCRWGDCNSVSIPSCPQFEDLDFTVMDFDPSWVDDPAGIASNRLCLFACVSCWGLFESCGGCDETYYEGGACLSKIMCGPNSKTVVVSHPFQGCRQACSENTTSMFCRECHSRTAILTGKQVASSDYYFFMDRCTDPMDPMDGFGNLIDPCEVCRVLLYENCACGNPDGCAPIRFMYYRPVYRQILRGGSPGCYTFDREIIGYNNIPDNASGPWSAWSTALYVNCSVWNPPYNCFADCTDCPGEPGVPPYTCCNPPPQGAAQENDGEGHPSLFPSEFATTLVIDNQWIKTDVQITFVRPVVPSQTLEEENDVTDGIVLWEVDSIEQRKPWIYSVGEHHAFTTISEHAANGAFAVDGVPNVGHGIYLGHFSDGDTEWSAWLAVTVCVAQTIESMNARVFAFSYSVFAYCDKNCVGGAPSRMLEEQKGVVFQVTIPPVEIEAAS